MVAPSRPPKAGRARQVVQVMPPQSGRPHRHRELLKYGDGLMQLVRLSAYFDVPTAPPDSSAKKHLTVVVIDADHVNIGLIISQVKGTIDIPKKLAESVSDRPGLLGYAIVGDRLVNVLDINEFVLNRMSELNN